MTRLSVCDYHDLPLVCGVCGKPRDDQDRGHIIEWEPHDFQPVHKREDPEGMELTQLIPCQLE